MIEVGKIYEIPDNSPIWRTHYVKVTRLDINNQAVYAIELGTDKGWSYHKSWLNPLPKELADLSEEELKFYLAL